MTYRSPVKVWQVSRFGLGTITLNDTDTTAKRLDRNLKKFSADSSAIFANNGVSAIQSYCPQNKPADLPLLLETGTKGQIFYLKYCHHTGLYLMQLVAMIPMMVLALP